jgi:hypothetical protein
VLEPDHLADGRRDLGEGVGALCIGSPGGVEDAVVQVVAQQADSDFLQSPGRGRNLGNDVRAPGIAIDHSLEATDLALNLLQPP